MCPREAEADSGRRKGEGGERRKEEGRGGDEGREGSGGRRVGGRGEGKGEEGGRREKEEERREEGRGKEAFPGRNPNECLDAEGRTRGCSGCRGGSRVVRGGLRASATPCLGGVIFVPHLAFK